MKQSLELEEQRRAADRRRRRPAPVFNLGPANVWLCVQCKAHGDASFAPDVTVVAAVEQIRKAHKLASPDCDGTAFIRLVNLEQLRAKGLVA